MMRHYLIWLSLLGAIILFGCGKKEVTLTGEWRFMIDSLDRGDKEEWYLVEHDRSLWSDASVPGFWDQIGLDTYDGVGWYSRWFIWDDPNPASLIFEGVDDDATVWVNGIAVGQHVGHSEPFTVSIGDSIMSDSMLVVIRVMDHGGPGGIHKPVSAVPTSEVGEYMKSPYADEEARQSADWVRSAIVYEVYLRSFSDEGSFDALRTRLPELKDLGVSVVWLMPIHPIGDLNRKGTLGSPYAVQDFRDVNPEFGSLQDFRNLVDAVHELDMKIIIDLVANHTSWDNEMLIRHPEWYTRDDEGAIVTPHPDWYDVADLNYDGHELRKHMIDVIQYWVQDIGIDGYRCDVAELVPLDFWVHARHELDNIRPVLMLSEGTLPEHHLEAFDITYAWSTYDMLDPLFDGTLDATVIPRILRRESWRFPKGSLRLRFHTNHDKNAWDEPAVEKWGDDGVLLASATMYVLPGVPLLYNGEEVGNQKRLDLFESVPIDWGADQKFRAHFKKLGAIRQQYPWLSTGPWREIQQSISRQTLLLMRTDEPGGEAVLAILNYSESSVNIDIPMPVEFKDRMLRDHFTETRIPAADRFVVTLPAKGFSIISSR